MSTEIVADPQVEHGRPAERPGAVREPPTDDRAPEPPRESAREPAGRTGHRRSPGQPLPLGTRVVLATLGSLLLILGVAGLFLPFLQGILLLMLAAAVLSLASDTVYGWLEGLLSQRTPAFWKRVERFRTRVRWRFRR